MQGHHQQQQSIPADNHCLELVADRLRLADLLRERAIDVVVHLAHKQVEKINRLE